MVVCHMVEARHGVSGVVEVSVIPKITCMISQCYKPVHYIICLKLFIYLAPSCRAITILSSELAPVSITSDSRILTGAWVSLTATS